MSDDTWLSGRAVRPLVDELIERAVRRYRVEPETARRLVEEVLAKDRDLRRLAEAETSPERLGRTRAFKQAAAAAGRKVYCHLRRYTPAEEELAPLVARMDALGPQAAAAQRDAAALALVAAHKSTAERLPALDEFHRQLFAHVACPATVLDVGCGLYPLVFPFDGAASGVTRYVAVDRDPKAAAAVAAYARARGDGRVVAERWELQTGWDEVLGRSGLDGFDLALVLKMVPVIARQQRSLLTVLARTPATRWIVSGSRVSMTRRRSIERRERAVLHKFVASAGRRVEAEFVAGEEFAFVVV